MVTTIQQITFPFGGMLAIAMIVTMLMLGALSAAGMGAAGMAAGLAKKGARGGKRVGSKASSTLGSGDGAFMGGMAGGFLASDEDGTQSFSSNTGMDDSIADAPEPVSAVGATGDTPDSFERVDRPGRPTQADRAPDPNVDEWDTYVAKAGGDEAVAHEFMQNDRQMVAQQRELVAQEQQMESLQQEIQSLTDDSGGDDSVGKGLLKESNKSMVAEGIKKIATPVLAGGGAEAAGSSPEMAITITGLAGAGAYFGAEGTGKAYDDGKQWLNRQRQNFSIGYHAGKGWMDEKLGGIDETVNSHDKYE
ncbi:FtsB/FtsL family cell division protein [Halococcoides cellulosivorans]|uniref:Uncharacterized protein n=1 Tax=Halococcoides cellulosivorans TaxID=1679096 RepID=A0A2R4WYV4_9EURY|nr:hypothetical protein [Halococcoides cellulosivorans]AWB26729.1 hypothetical protein HARCEL1_02870 [Halococcoides cellulosivorans]